VTYQSRQARVDPWRVRGWRIGSGVGLQVLAVAAVLATLFSILMGALFVDERAYERDERANYIAVRGEVMDASEGGLVFSGESAETGPVEVSLDEFADAYPGDRVTLLVRRGEVSDYLLPSERALPAVPLGILVVVGTAAVTTAVLLVLIARRRRGDADPVRAVATVPPETHAPGPLTSVAPLRRGVVAALASGAVALALLAASLGTHALDVAHERPGVATVDGYVRNGSDDLGRPAMIVSFYDSRQNGANTRPVTPAEIARGVKVGDTIPVTYVTDTAPVGHGAAVGYGGLAAVAALLAVALGGRALAWPLRLRRARRGPARPVEVVAWLRVVRGRAWLVLWPAAETRARKAVAVPLDPAGDLPAAIAGTVHVHGRRRGGHAVILREPGGAPLWPAGPARGALWATLTGVSVLPPNAPASYPPWGYAAWSPPAGA
jgi:hypothetical protein